jgi:hypothetical protein
MKPVIIVLFFLVSSVISFKPPTLESPSVVTVTVAQACGGWWDPCCPWWEPWKCPAPVPQNKKDVAQNKADYYDSAAYSLGVITAAMALGLPESAIAFGIAGSTGLIAKQLAEDQRRIIRNIQDADYWVGYDPPWQSAESLGLSYTENYWVNQMVGDTQGVAQMADMISVESAKALACEQAGADCGPWHRDRVNWALWYLGWYINDLGDNAWQAAAELEAQGVNPDLVYQIRALAWESNDAGWRYQQ